MSEHVNRYLHIHPLNRVTAALIYIFNIVFQSTVWSEEELSTSVSVAMTQRKITNTAPCLFTLDPLKSRSYKHFTALNLKAKTCNTGTIQKQIKYFHLFQLNVKSRE